MSEEEEYDEDEEGEEEEEEEGEEVDEGVDKTEKVKDDISLILDVFAYIDRTSKRMASRLELESAMTAPQKGHSFPEGVGMNHEEEITNMDRHALEGVGSNVGGAGGFNPSWSNYENLTEAERGQLLEKAIMTLGEQPQQVIVQTDIRENSRKRGK